jgi:L-fuconate dehydratase
MIVSYETRDIRFPLAHGSGSDAVHRNPVYSYAVLLLRDDSGITATGLSFTLGEGNDLVCKAAEFYAKYLIGKDIEELMDGFGSVFNKLSNDPQFRWIGPHKGVVHLALAAITNCCFDLWAKKRKVPLWKLLIGLEPEQIVNTLDLSYLEEELTREQAIQMICSVKDGREQRSSILHKGYTGYDTSIGWFNYSDELIRENCRRAIDQGFMAMKLKVGFHDPEKDLRRAQIVREEAGNERKVMLDVNQQWTLPQALAMCRKLQSVNPYWIEEPTHPDDVIAHKKLADAIPSVRLAIGEHVPNRIVFKNYLQSKCVGFIQVDALRVGGVSEFITVSLLSKKYGIPVTPHVGDMGQLHQHLVLFNHIAIGHEALFLEYIPHLREHFVNPVDVSDGVYKTPQEAGAGCDLKL